MAKKDTTIRVRMTSKEWMDNWSKELMLPRKVEFLEEIRKSDKINKMLCEEKNKRMKEFLKDRRIL